MKICTTEQCTYYTSAPLKESFLCDFVVPMMLDANLCLVAFSFLPFAGTLRQEMRPKMLKYRVKLLTIYVEYFFEEVIVTYLAKKFPAHYFDHCPDNGDSTHL